jgi:hypothetical protein
MRSRFFAGGFTALPSAEVLPPGPAPIVPRWLYIPLFTETEANTRVKRLYLPLLVIKPSKSTGFSVINGL